MGSNLIYLAGPIDQVNGLSWGDGWMETRQLVRKSLTSAGFDMYSPGRAFEAGSPGMSGLYIDEVNQYALRKSSAVVAFLPMNVATLGTAVEIERMAQSGRPVLIVTNIVNSVQMFAWDQHYNVKVVLPHEHAVEGGVDWVSKMVAQSDIIDDRADLVFSPLDAAYAELPTRGYDSDAGFDLYTVEDTVIPAGEFVDVPTGVAVDLPDGTWGMITGRSSTLRRRNLLVSTGIIDNGWTGPLFAGCKNLSDQPVTVKRGERVAQIILFRTTAETYKARWGTIRTKDRGEQGFGSTGA